MINLNQLNAAELEYVRNSSKKLLEQRISKFFELAVQRGNVPIHCEDRIHIQKYLNSNMSHSGKFDIQTYQMSFDKIGQDQFRIYFNNQGAYFKSKSYIQVPTGAIDDPEYYLNHIDNLRMMDILSS